MDEKARSKEVIWRSIMQICEAIEIASVGAIVKASKSPPIISGLSIHLLIHTFFWLTFGLMELWTKSWFSERHPNGFAPIKSCIGSISTDSCARLSEVEVVAFSRLFHHYEISRILQCYQFGFLSAAFWSSTLFAAAAFTIVRKGIDDTGPVVRAVILSTAVSSAFFGGFPSLVSIDENIKSNLDSYNAYDGIFSEVRTFARTGQSITGNHVDGVSFLHKVDLMFADLPAARIQFDATQVDSGKSRFFKLSEELESAPGVRDSHPAAETQAGVTIVEEEDPAYKLYLMQGRKEADR